MKERVLAETILNRGGTTIVPESVIEALGLKPKLGERSKLLWTIGGHEAFVTKGTAQSDWRKTMLRRNGTAAIPKHVQQALMLKLAPMSEVKILWTRQGERVIVRKG